MVEVEQHPTPLPARGVLAYSLGSIGWSSVSQVVGIQLIYFYIPPSGGGCTGLTANGSIILFQETANATGTEPIFPTYVTTAQFAVIFNVIALVAAAGRLWDAVTDPCIASYSDRLQSRRGRRIPMLAVGGLPTAAFAALLFFPIVQSESAWNIVWLVIIQFFFYLFYTVYVTPFFALVPDLGVTDKLRLDLSMAGSIGFAVGSVVGGSAPILGGLFGFTRPEQSLQAGVVTVCAIGLALMYVPVVAIDEPAHSLPPSAAASLFAGIQHCLRSRHFRCYAACDFAFFFSSSIIQTALPFYLTVLTCETLDLLTLVIGGIVLLSIPCYPVVAALARRHGKKRLILFALLMQACVFVLVFFLGAPLLPLPPRVQMLALPALLAFSISVMGMLPNAVLAEVAVHDALRTGRSNEGLFFAARSFLQKIGVTLGVVVFASLTNFGNSPGDDLGVRLSGPACVVVLAFAFVAFTFYDEKGLQRELEGLQRRGGAITASAQWDTCSGAAPAAETIQQPTSASPSLLNVYPAPTALRPLAMGGNDSGGVCAKNVSSFRVWLTGAGGRIRVSPE